MRRIQFRLLACATALLCLIAVSGTQAQAGQSASLQALIDGLGPNGDGTLIEGDKIFSDFTNYSSNASGGADPVNAATIFGTTFTDSSGNICIRWQSASWHIDSAETQDTSWTYTITSTGRFIHDSLLIFGSGDVDGDGEIHISDSLSNGVNLSIDVAAGKLSDHALFTPVQSLNVNKDVALSSVNNGSAFVSDFVQCYSQVGTTPEPATMASLGIAGLIGLGVVARRRFAKSAV